MRHEQLQKLYIRVYLSLDAENDSLYDLGQNFIAVSLIQSGGDT